MLNVKWGKEKLWERLLRIERTIRVLYEALTKPLNKYATKIITRLPFSCFFFRPLVLNELFMALGLWEPYVRRNLVLREGDVFIDIGAHIGYYTVYTSQKVGKDGLVIAIEPDRRNLKVLHKNVKTIRANNVLVYEVAAGFNGFLYLSPQENPLLTKTTRKDAGGQNRIPSISLDSLLDEIGKNTKFHSVIVKIDVEGGELDIIKGGLLFLKNLSPTLIIETENPSELEATLKQFGYTCSKIFKNYFMFLTI